MILAMVRGEAASFVVCQYLVLELQPFQVIYGGQVGQCQGKCSTNPYPQRTHILRLLGPAALTNPYPQRTHVLRLLGPKTLLYKALIKGEGRYLNPAEPLQNQGIYGTLVPLFP